MSVVCIRQKTPQIHVHGKHTNKICQLCNDRKFLLLSNSIAHCLRLSVGFIVWTAHLFSVEVDSGSVNECPYKSTNHYCSREIKIFLKITIIF